MLRDRLDAAAIMLKLDLRTGVVTNGFLIPQLYNMGGIKAIKTGKYRTIFVKGNTLILFDKNRFLWSFQALPKGSLADIDYQMRRFLSDL